MDGAEVEWYGEADQYAGGEGIIEVDGDGYAVAEQVGVEADVLFCSGFPVDGRVYEDGLVLADDGGLADAVDCAGRVIEYGEIGERPVGVEGAADAQFTVGAAELEVVDPGDIKEFFLADAPGCGGGGEITRSFCGPKRLSSSMRPVRVRR